MWENNTVGGVLVPMKPGSSILVDAPYEIHVLARFTREVCGSPSAPSCFAASLLCGRVSFMPKSWGDLGGFAAPPPHPVCPPRVTVVHAPD